MSLGIWLLGAGKGILNFALRHWVWFALAAALIYARHLGVEAANSRHALDDANKARVVAEANAKAWEQHAAESQRLAEATLAARAQEQATLLSIAKALGATKQGIMNAPGASDTFRYSDALYGWMRDGRGNQPTETAPVVDGR